MYVIDHNENDGECRYILGESFAVGNRLKKQMDVFERQA